MNLRSHPHLCCSASPRGSRPKALALAASALFATSTAIAAVNHVVTTCADALTPPDCSSGDDGTLRTALRCALNKDTVDLTHLTCSKITLAGSLIAGTVTVTVNGPGRDKLTIDAGGQFRAFIHNGVYSNTLYLNKLTIRNGSYVNPYDYSNGGGCIYSSANLSLNAVTVSSCYTSATLTAATGGAIFARTGAFLTDTIVADSTAIDHGGHGAFGGGIVAGRTVLIRSTISGNTATSNAFARGGGAQGYGVYASYSTISGNAADSTGGGIYAQNLLLSDSTLSGNHTSINGLIGGAYARVSAQIDNSTITGNYSGSGLAAGLYVGLRAQGTAFVASSIIANNTAYGFELDLGAPSGKSISGSYNLIRTPQDNIIVPAGTIIGVDPLLGPLQANGGPTLTHALLPGSPALDHGGNPAHLKADQRGVTRIENGIADIGAFESDRIFGDGFQPVAVALMRRDSLTNVR